MKKFAYSKKNMKGTSPEMVYVLLGVITLLVIILLATKYLQIK